MFKVNSNVVLMQCNFNVFHVKNGKVREKVYGKQKVYTVDQMQFPQATSDELRTMDENVEQLEKLCKQNQDEVHQLNNQLKLVNSSMTTEDARALVEKVKNIIHYATKIISQAEWCLPI